MGAPPPDATVAAQIDRQFQQGAQAQQATLSAAEVAPGSAPAGPPATISLGQTTDQVVAILGQPKNIVDLGEEDLRLSGLKITFNNGQVSDVNDHPRLR